ncbi:MerR family transcriptional regulator [Streptomyces capillispiralis]|uniref:DNA-binding transcriptional MerR regulator n=1 Tax=Streptomyces capillispiralis TaxID=68182 RepID=A0A561TAP4_9ACTN|nr:MerR family transcriptional regulator [Streptomyces capillispiralis]TWF84197.1 DNA-binding transcriptional MerR regulator [Streptomyces capillispiralis]GHH92906.1 transcriptional regulator [Streptomyces capillispiralis]
MSALTGNGEQGDGERVPPGGGLTTGEVARRLGVAPTTVRTWDRRYGLGPEDRTGGRHRRWTAGDVARLERMCALTATGLPPAEAARLARGEEPPPPTPERRAPARETAAGSRRPPARSRAGSGLRLGDVRQECKGIARAALRLDAAALDRLLLAAITDHGLVAAWTEVIVPTLQAVGRKWESSGERYVEVEHFLSWHVSGALRRTTPATVADRPGATTVLACVPGENHTLPLEVLSAALTERGVPVRMFGGALPVESLVAAVRRTGPAAVGLWAQSRTTASRPLAQHVAGMEWGVRGARRRPVVLTLGPGWAGQTVAGLARPAGLAEAVAALESVVAR